MTIETQTSKVRYQGNGITTVWPVPFPVVSDEHLRLVVADANEKSEPIQSGYQVSGLSTENVSVEYPTSGEPLAPGKKLIIYREMPLTQTLDLERGGSFDAEVIERQGFDHVVMQIQQLDEQSERSLQVPITSEQTPEELLNDIFIARDQAVQSASNADTSATIATTEAGLSEDSAEASANSAAQSEASSLESIEHAAISESWSDKANQWAENPIDEPVEHDAQGNPLYSAKHWAHEAAEIQVNPATTEIRGGVRVGYGLNITEIDTLNVDIATTTLRGIARIATPEEALSGRTGENGPVFLTLEQVKLLINAIQIADIGDIKFSPFRSTELPEGWYFANGDRYALTSPQGIALSGLPANYKTDWGISESDNTINIPKFFYSDGRGYFIRATNGMTRQVGSVQLDAMQRLTGNVSSGATNDRGYFQNGYLTGCFAPAFGTTNACGGSPFPGWIRGFTFDNTRQARTSSENVSLNIGMTPTIYLGVPQNA